LEKTVISRSEGETEALGAALAQELRAGDCVAFFGGLGMGKTAFVRGMARALGCEAPVSSPTYALVNVYPGKMPLAHFDMYRVEGWESLLSTGFYDYLEQDCVLAVEWSEHIAQELPPACWRVEIRPGKNDGERRLRITKGGRE
jgi:tRNA threonylcarbamoyladenosine biosynthesis protein TsaE